MDGWNLEHVQPVLSLFVFHFVLVSWEIDSMILTVHDAVQVPSKLAN